MHKKICPLCGGDMFDADNDLCQSCDKWFPAVEKTKISIPASPVAGPVWVKAKNYEGKGAWKLCRVNSGEPIPLRITRPDFIVDMAGKSYSHYDVEYLDESAPPSFTPSQIEMAFYAACNGINPYLGDNAAPIEEIKKLHKEYMDTNFPNSKT